jgi:hypothetical protein
VAKRTKTTDGGEALTALAALTISTGDFAALVGLTPAAVGIRIRAGAIPKEGHGKLNLVAAVQGFLKYEADLAARAETRAKDSTRNRLQTARANEVEARLARQMRDLIPRADAIEAMALVAEIEVAHLQAMESRLPREVRAELKASIAAIEVKRQELNRALATGVFE